MREFGAVRDNGRVPYTATPHPAREEARDDRPGPRSTPARPAGEPLADEPIPDAPPEGEAEGDGAAGSTRGREWIAQLEAMIQQISTQAAPVARQVGAKAAELAAVAAVKAGPVAQRAADLTTDYGQRFAEKAQSVAAELRAHDAGATDGADARAAGRRRRGETPPEADRPPRTTQATGL